MPPQKPRLVPKDFFLYIAAMATLYVSVASLLTLYFQAINLTFRDELDYYVDPYSGAMRFAVASLIVVFPLFILFTRLTNKDLRANPAKREGGLRKWLLYITLFIGGVTVAGDLIVLVNTFLGGEITTRFILKVLAVFVVVGGAFLYYLADLRGKWQENETLSKAIGWVVGGIVLLSLIGAFFVMGSPAEQRSLRFDAQRIAHLQEIQFQVVEYWRQKEELPETLSALEDPLVGFTGFVPPVDPETGEPYGYNATGPLSFEVCADFALPSREDQIKPRMVTSIVGVGTEGSWEHPAGAHCFERTIDPERFPPVEKRVPVPVR